MSSIIQPIVVHPHVLACGNRYPGGSEIQSFSTQLYATLHTACCSHFVLNIYQLCSVRKMHGLTPGNKTLQILKLQMKSGS